MSWITTYTGKKISLTNPKSEDVCIEDIAKGLSNICRFAGQIQDFYSVAEHSVHVARLLQIKGHNRETVIAGLLHDASEAYIGDITSPLKAQLRAYKEIEDRFSVAVYYQFCDLMPASKVDQEAIKRTDLEMLNIEAQEFYGEERTILWSMHIPSEKLPKLSVPIFKASPILAYDVFMRTFNELKE